MLAPLLGLSLSFRQSLIVVLMSFTIAAVILGALSPVALFVVWNTPVAHDDDPVVRGGIWFRATHVVTFITLACVWGNRALVPLLHEWSGSAWTARCVLLAWPARWTFCSATRLP